MPAAPLFLKCSPRPPPPPPTPQIDELILLHTVVVLHYTQHSKNDMKGHGKGYECCHNAQKQLKAYFAFFFVHTRVIWKVLSMAS